MEEATQEAGRRGMKGSRLSAGDICEAVRPVLRRRQKGNIDLAQGRNDAIAENERALAAKPDRKSARGAVSARKGIVASQRQREADGETIAQSICDRALVHRLMIFAAPTVWRTRRYAMKAMAISTVMNIGLGLWLVGAASAGPLVSPAALGPLAENAQYMPGSGFEYPKASGAIVDWCAVWANGCGWPGAHQFCRTKGFSQALGWDIFRPGHTFVVGSNQYCTGDGCKGFRFVRCG